MKKKVLILGSSGMLGHVVTLQFKGLSDIYDVIDVSRTTGLFKPSILLDVTNLDKIEALFKNIDPNIVINCVGILNSNAENNPADAILINSYFPHFLEKIASTTKCKLIHISTDCVFSGRKGFYIESDFMDAQGYYAKSKALGEVCNQKDLTIRTSIIGPELHTGGIGLFQWFSTCKGTIHGYSDVYWTGVTTIELSFAILKCIENDITGLCHMVNDERISKFQLLNLFKEFFPKTNVLLIEPSHKYAYDKSLLNTRKDISYNVPSYETMLIEMKEWIVNHIELYPHYKHLVV